MTSTVAFNGFDLTAVSARGGAFKVLGLEGWHTVTFRRDRQDKAQQTGAWESTGFSSALPITVRGQAVYASAASAALERREFLSLASVSSAPLTVDDAGGSGTRMVEPDSFVVSPVMDCMFTYSLVATACDPLLYGPTRFAQTPLASSLPGTGLPFPLAFPLDFGVPEGPPPGSLFLTNAGTASYFPRLRIDGPVTNPVVTLLETGDTVRFNGSLAAGQHLDINWGTPRRVTVGDNPVSVRQKVSYSGNWLAVPPGGATISWSGSGSGSLLSVWFYEGVYE